MNLVPSLRGRFRPAIVRLLAVSATVAFVAAACGGEGEQVAHADTAEAPAPPPPPYRVVDVAHAGAIVGTVTLAGELPEDTVVRVTMDQTVCGTSQRVPLIERRGDRVENVVVWLADARRGKALPVERRFEVTSEGCALVPRVQAAIAGGMLNVKNADPSTHRTRFLSDGHVLDIVQETDRGQVVPTAKVLARPGLVEVRCDLHPWVRGWIRVFDHPYFAVTNRDGTFTIDSVPPGTYHLVAWQARLGRREQAVTVAAATETTVEVAF